MTWIVKGTGGYEYACHPEGEVFAPELAEAYRHKNKASAVRVVKRMNRIMSEGLPYRVVRLRKRGPLRDALTSIVAFEAKPTVCPYMNEMIAIARAALSGGVGKP